MQSLTRNYYFIVLTGAVLLLLGLAIMSPSVARIALALPVIFFLPGYGLTTVLFARRALDIPVRVLFSVGLSLAMAALSGLILNLTLAGISLQNPLVTLLIGVPALVGLYSLVRDGVQADRTTAAGLVGFRPRQVLFLLLAVVIAATAVAIARTPTSTKNLTGYSMFWVQAGSVPNTLELGVQIEEFTTTSYQVRFQINDAMRDGPTFVLRPGEKWQYSLDLKGQAVGGQPVTLLLYRLDKPDQVYRRVVWYENN